MRKHLAILSICLAIWAAVVDPAPAQSPAADFRPDPKSVQRFGPAYRYPQDGWIVLHIEGEPYDRGFQHGQLMAREIADHIRCFATVQSSASPSDGWRHTRSLVNALFLRRYEKEYLEEMKGIADGATAAGAKFDGRPIDLLDIVAVNSWPEVETLDSALEATPVGLEGQRFAHPQPKAMPAPKPMHCSAFAATGPATADGKIVFGHITMFGLYPAYFYNVWLDVKPARGHRVIMQTYPGGMQSGLDYYMNDVGLLCCETTIAQTRFHSDGMSLASRIRQMMQYADDIDQAVEILKRGNNGLYTNEWLLGDTKTNEIAMFELGTFKTKLYRSGRKEWFGGTEGFYWGCNNTKDLEVRLETLASVDERPANAVFVPSNRDKKWVELYRAHKGKIDANFGKLAFTTPPLSAFSSLDAKFTTSDMAKDLKSWALFGPPLGRTWQPTPEERKRFPEVRPLVSNPWTVLHGQPPAPTDSGSLLAVDLKPDSGEKPAERTPRATLPAWRGTLLPRSDSDIWLTSAWADYERIVSREQSYSDPEKKPKPERSIEDRTRLGQDLFARRTAYLAAVQASGETPLSRTKSDFADSSWHQVAANRGTLMLNELRKDVGGDRFAVMMDQFGSSFAGKPIAVEQFAGKVKTFTKKDPRAFFTAWTETLGLPRLQLDSASVSKENGSGHAVRVQIGVRDGNPIQLASVPVTVETTKGEVTKEVAVGASATILVQEAPVRVVVDKYAEAPKANGGTYSINSFHGELEQTLIVYGTKSESQTNKEAAEGLQAGLLRGPNILVPIKKDVDVTEAEVRSKHLLLIGRPSVNRLAERFRQSFPIEFGPGSFRVDTAWYAHPLSATIAATANPHNARYSMVLMAGLGAESTLDVATKLLTRGTRGADVLVFPHRGQSKAVIAPAPELVRELDKPAPTAAGGG